MRTLVRWNPGREMMNMRYNLDRLMSDMSGGHMPVEEKINYMPLDVVETEDGFELSASLPGVNSDNIEVVMEDNLLTIKAEVTSDEEIKEDKFHLRERRYGKFARSLRLPVDIEAGNIEAKYANGVLTLNLPKAEEVKPKRISVNVA